MLAVPSPSIKGFPANPKILYAVRSAERAGDEVATTAGGGTVRSVGDVAPSLGKAKVSDSPNVGSTSHATAETPGFQPIPRRNIASKAVASSGREK